MGWGGENGEDLRFVMGGWERFGREEGGGGGGLGCLHARYDKGS